MALEEGLKQLARDFSRHPLMPGALLASLAGNAESRREAPLSYAELIAFNQKDTLEILTHFQEACVLDNAAAGNLLKIESAYLQAWKSLRRHIPEIASVTDCREASVEGLAQALFSAKYLSECLEILTPPDLSYERTSEGTLDLLEELYNAFRTIVGGAWSVFFPRGDFSLRTDAAAQFWVACLYQSRPEEMAAAFTGVFRAANRDRLQALNGREPARRGLSLPDGLSDYVKQSPEKVSHLYDAVEADVKRGLDRSFQEISRVLAKLQLPALVIFFYDRLIDAVCRAFAEMDGTVSSKENRFTHYLLKRVDLLSQQHHVEVSEPESQTGRQQLEKVLAELDELIGLEPVKEKVRGIANFVRLQQLRQERDLPVIPTSYHAVYTGHPGTGKTTVARLMGRIFKALGVLKKGHLVECDRSALTAEFVGQTGPKTNRVIDSALDGILFIDEAYSLAREGKDYGQEAIETLLKRMEDDRDRLIVIVAGYPKEMEEFVNSNPGLRSRFTRFINFPDFSRLELCRIFSLMCRRHALVMSPELKAKLIHHFDRQHDEGRNDEGNARLVRNCFESVIHAQAARLVALDAPDSEQLSRLEATDLKSAVEEEWKDFLARGGRYQVNCAHCDQVYTWMAEWNLGLAQCTACGKTYDAEFGERVQ